MTLPLPTSVDDPSVQQTLDAIARAFPIALANMAKNSVGAAQLVKEAVTDEKLASPVIRGLVSTEGVKLAGSGFAVEKTATGKYKITLTTELTTEGVCVATASSLVRPCAIEETGKKVFKVGITDAAGVAQNSAFNFMIMKT